MEFTSRGNSQGAPTGRRKKIDWEARTVHIGFFIVVVICAILLILVSLYLALSGGINNENSLVKSDKYQAVFLNGGSTSGSVTYSTYFGHVTDLNGKYMVLKDVYYLTTDSSSSSSSSSNPQLIKLGCQQLHAPDDQMVINRDQVAFWENLQDSGKVVQAIQAYIKQNPNGPNCSQTTSNSSSTTQSTTTPSSSTSTPSTTDNSTTKP